MRNLLFQQLTFRRAAFKSHRYFTFQTSRHTGKFPPNMTRIRRVPQASRDVGSRRRLRKLRNCVRRMSQLRAPEMFSRARDPIAIATFRNLRERTSGYFSSYISLGISAEDRPERDAAIRPLAISLPASIAVVCETNGDVVVNIDIKVSSTVAQIVRGDELTRATRIR